MSFAKESTPEKTHLIEHDISFGIFKVISKLCDTISREDAHSFSQVLIVCAKQSEMIRMRKYLHLFRRLQPSNLSAT